MAKKKVGKGNVKASKAAKKEKASQKTERKVKKQNSKNEPKEDEDLEAVLSQMQKEWEDVHTVTEELVEGPPSRRASATLTACPNGAHLWCIGGEFFSEDKKAYFYNDVFRYTPEKDEWKKFVSKTCPGPRSAHAVVGSPAGGGKLFLFGGEFSSVSQNSFHHYRDFWCFDIPTHSWDRIDTKILPSARSGHRMAIWKHYIIVFGGFYDPGITTRYLNDLWVFDTQEYIWKQVEFKPTEPKPSPRSGFSFISTPEGIVLHGGYCKEYAKGKRPIGVMLDDTWFLRISLNTPPEPTTPASKSKAPQEALIIKWERRKRPSTAYAPSLRSGCSMAAWPAKSTGVLFGGVTDEDTSEETLESIFWNDLNGYQWQGKGKWVSMNLKRPKRKGGKKKVVVNNNRGDDEDDEDNLGNEEPEIDPDDPILTTPRPRYNAMLAVLKNTLYIYGGIFERGSREYTLDDFYCIQLDKMEKYVCLRESAITIEDGIDESSSEEEEDDDEDDDEDEDEGFASEKSDDEYELEDAVDELPEPETLDVTMEDPDLRAQATAFMGAKDVTRSPEEIVSTPLPGETLALFYARSREYWAQQAHQAGEDVRQGKELRRDGFSMAQDRYREYKPLLSEVEKILAEAGLDENEMRNVASGMGGAGQGTQTSRNRR